jgi:hypothetical protein
MANHMALTSYHRACLELLNPGAAAKSVNPQSTHVAQIQKWRTTRWPQTFANSVFSSHILSAYLCKTVVFSSSERWISEISRAILSWGIGYSFTL